LSLPEYTFVPWLRRGLAAEIAEADALAADPGAAATVGRATLDVELTLDVVPAPGAPPPPRPTIKRKVGILGPGDVATLKAEAILRTHPADGVLGATPDELAFVEFYDEDLPWRYTPAKAASSRLRPWLALLVLTEEEFTVREPGAPGQPQLPVVTLTDRAQLPPAEETWAWAHAQLSTIVAQAADVGAAIAADPDHARSRLLSPRRLVADTQFDAFLVPAFEAGRLAALGRPTDGVPAQQAAWGLPQHATDRDLPVFHHFRFRTAVDGDFETLARRLVPRAAGEEFGKRLLDVSAPGFGLDERDGATVDFEGALAPPQMPRTAFVDPWDAVAEDLVETLDAGDAALQPAVVTPDPMVVPPAYGRRQKGLRRVVDARNQADLAWLAELNLDLRSRAAAGLGTEVVRQRQDEYMQRAWEQVGRIEEANQRLREAELARASAQAVKRKHLQPLDGDDRLTQLTAVAQSGLRAPSGLPVVAGGDAVGADQVPNTASLRAAVGVSRVPAAAQAPAFRRITRAQRPLMRRLGDAGRPQQFQSDLLTKMDQPPATALTVAPAAPDPAAGVALSSVQTAVDDSIQRLVAIGERPFEVFLTLADTWAGGQPSTTDFDTLGAPAAIAGLQAKVRARYPQVNFNGTAVPDAPEWRVWALAAAVTAVASDGPGRAKLTIDDAIFEREFSDDALGKARGAVTVVRGGAPPPDATIGRTTSTEDVQAFGRALNDFAGGAAARPDPAPAKELDTSSVASHVLTLLDPVLTLGDRVAAAVPIVAGRPPDRLLTPVMAHPTFPDPLFWPLRDLSQDHVVPNVSDLPRESLTVMEPNRRFIESYLAGVNFAFNQELLWREYPTDQRGTSFRVFWDTRDAVGPPRPPDVKPMADWTGALGSQATSPAAVLVLVVRGELLERFPSTVIFAQRAAFAGNDALAPRVLDPNTPVKDPIFSGRLEPDIRLVGFELSVAQARGRRVADADGPSDPGWFFVFMERPGEPRFGLDSGDEAPPLKTWDDLAWASFDPAGLPFVRIAANASLVPTDSVTAVWGRTAADQASILLQNPVLLARHASEMLK
jgi:hypothetical protein